MIVCENVTRTYGEFTAVQDVSFTIGKGEIVGLLGHNGAGKTTIMKMLTGYLEPTEGRVEIDGHEVQANRIETQRKVGYLPENCPVYGEMRVLEYLEYVCELRGVPARERARAIRDVVETTRIADKALSPISTLSRGYRQRVGVAQAIIHRPEILILDEPTNGLDPTQIQEMRELIRNLSQDATVILSTHILQEVQATCGRVIIIRNGALALDSRLEDLRSSNRLLVSVQGDASKFEASVASLPGLKRIQARSSSNGGPQEFVLEIEPNGHPVAPELAKTIISAGLELHALHPERRDLETVFAEINSESKGA